MFSFLVPPRWFLEQNTLKASWRMSGRMSLHWTPQDRGGGERGIEVRHLTHAI